MSDKKVAVLGIYSSRLAVENATDSLMKAGFQASDISVLMPETVGGVKTMGTEKATKAPEGTTAGGVIGGTLGVLAGVGLLAIPGLGPFIAAGPIIAGLAGLGVGGAVGGITGALIGMGVPEFEAKRYEGHLQRGGILLSVHCDTGKSCVPRKLSGPRAGRKLPPRENLLLTQRQPITISPAKLLARLTSLEGESLGEVFSFLSKPKIGTV